MTKPGVSICIVYTDEHLLELRVQACNDAFAGQANVYADSEITRQFADLLRGFPDSCSDTREIELGTFDNAYAGGGASFRFYCIDSVGHAIVEVGLRTDPRLGVGTSDVATLHIPVEASLIDSFVRELERMAPEDGQTAVLNGAA
jgi:hypothetical protein